MFSVWASNGSDWMLKTSAAGRSWSETSLGLFSRHISQYVKSQWVENHSHVYFYIRAGIEQYKLVWHFYPRFENLLKQNSSPYVSRFRKTKIWMCQLVHWLTKWFVIVRTEWYFNYTTEKTATVVHHRNPHIKLTHTLTNNRTHSPTQSIVDTLSHMYIFTIIHTHTQNNA